MLPLLVGAAGMLLGGIIGHQRREEDRAAKERDAAIKRADHEMAPYEKSGDWQIFDSMKDQWGVSPGFQGAQQRAQMLGTRNFMQAAQEGVPTTAIPHPMGARALLGEGGFNPMQMAMGAQGQQSALPNQMGVQPGGGQPGMPMGMPQGYLPSGMATATPQWQAQPPQPGLLPWSSEQSAAQPPQAGRMPSLAPTPALGQGATTTQMEIPPTVGGTNRFMGGREADYTPSGAYNYGDPSGNRGIIPAPDTHPQPLEPGGSMVVRDDQIAPPVVRPQAPMALQFPALRKATESKIGSPTGDITVHNKGLDSGSMTTAIIGDARAKGITPDDLQAQHAQQVIATGGKYPELDQQQFTNFRDRYFNERVGQKVIDLQRTAKSTAPATLQQLAEREVFNELHYLPTKGGALAGFSQEEVHLAGINDATMEANRRLEIAIEVVKSGGKYQPDFGKSFTDTIDNSPTMTPEQKDSIKRGMAGQIAQKLILRADPADPFGRMKAMLIAANMTGGAIPHEWQSMVAGDPKSFGFSQAMADEYLTGKHNIFQPGGYEHLKNAVAQQALEGKVVDRQLADPGKADVYAGAAQQLSQPQDPTKSLASMGPASRAIDVQQRQEESIAGVRGTKIEERRQVIESVAQPLSELARSMKRFMDISVTSPGDAIQAGKLYKSQLTTFRSIIAKGVLLQSGALNELEQQAAIDAFSGLIEAKAFPDVADEKIQTLNRIMTKAFGKPVDLLSDDPLNPQAVQALRFDARGNPVGDTATRLAQMRNPQQPPTAVAGQQPVPGPQPVPGQQPVAGPQPIAPAQAVPGMQPVAPPQARQPLGQLGTEIIGKTDEGRPIVKNPDGTVSTERSITLQIDGKWTNIPSMFGGKEVSDEEAAAIIKKNNMVDPETGRKMPTFKSEKEASREAERRSREDLGKYGQGGGLPPISDQAATYKQRFPQEAAPKVGPGSTSDAAKSLPKDMTTKLQHQDKIELATALHQYKTGEIDEQRLETSIAKVYGRFLTGKQLNEAVAGTMSVMRKSRKPKEANAAR